MALLPEIARQPLETRQAYTHHLQILVDQLSAKLTHIENPQSVALALMATLFGTLEMARAVEGTELSDLILSAGRDAARKLAETAT